MIRRCVEKDFAGIHAAINEAAQIYKGTIPADRWTEPYMSSEDLKHEIDSGVMFWVYEDDESILGVMGIQDVEDVTLIRHAYVLPASQKRGLGARLLSHLRALTSKRMLIGTWADATWAIRFYQKHGFQVVPDIQKDFLLKKYWKVPQRQIETSVVLADQPWSEANA